MTTKDKDESVADRIEAAAARAEAAAARIEKARSSGPVTPGVPNINSVTCEICGHVGAPMPDGICPNNNCPTRA